MSEVELFFTTYEHTAWAFFSFNGFLFVVYRVYLSISGIRVKKEARLVDIESRLYHLDNAKDGRVNKLSVLCESQIASNKEALVKAERAITLAEVKNQPQ